MSAIGASEPGTRPTQVLQVQALDGIHQATLGALGRAWELQEERDDLLAQCEDPHARQGIEDDYAGQRSGLGTIVGREVANHRQVLNGIVQERRRLDQISRDIINDLLGAGFAAAGPLLGGLRYLANQSARLAIEGSVRDFIKNRVVHATQSLAGASASDLERRFTAAFATTIGEYENLWLGREGEPRLPPYVRAMINDIRGAYTLARE
jgi:hypothetical protein